MNRIAVIAVNVAVVLAILKAADIYLDKKLPPVIPDLDASFTTLRTGELYPFTGMHMQAHARERWSPVLWDKTYPDYDVRSGEYGFWIDHRFESWPAKAPNEIRIILTGGSAAQGWGGRTNAEMFYKLLPEALGKGTACKVDVINMAMGGSLSYQNFIALNRWGHTLAPDAILSFSGHNEMGDDGFTALAAAAGSQYVLRYSASPAWLKGVAWVFPGIVKHTKLGPLVRMFYLDSYVRSWRQAYADSRGVPLNAPLGDVVKTIGAPLYMHALASIARDFPGIPVYAVLQPLAGTSKTYDDLREQVTGKVAGVTFYDMHLDWMKNNFYPGAFVDAMHLSNKGHVLVTGYLADLLRPFVEGKCRQIAG